VKSRVAALVAVLVAAAGAGAGAWLLTGDSSPHHPEISVYSHGNLTKVGPYQYCDVLDLDNCQTPATLGNLAVTSADPVQLSVPSTIGRAPWLLSVWYQNPEDTVTAMFRPGSRLAVTIPTVDPARGRLTGVTVQLLTLVRMPHDELVAATHADWSVRMRWD
jgi:hypothetical protein